MSKNKNYMVIMVALVAMLLMILPVSAITPMAKNIGPGSTIFVGEEGLNITLAMDGHTTIGYWTSGSDCSVDGSANTISISGRESSFSVTPSEFSSYLGTWYQVDGSHCADVAFWVRDPSVSMSIRTSNNENVGGKTVVAGANLTFKIDTNVYLDANRGDNLITITSPKVESFTALMDPSTGIVAFTPNSTDAGQVGATYKWDFGDSNTSTSKIALHTYVAPTLRTVTLTVTNTTTGMKSVVSAPITINAVTYLDGTLTNVNITPPGSTDAPVASFTKSINPTTGEVTFTDASTLSPNRWNWSFGDVSSLSGEQNPKHIYSSSGTYNVKFEVWNTTVSVTHSIMSANIVISQIHTSSLGSFTPIPATDSSITRYIRNTPAVGYMKIIVKTESGSTYDRLVTSETGMLTKSLGDIYPTTSEFLWGDGISYWVTNAKDSSGNRMYQSGIYTAYVECDLNGMKENYQTAGGSYYTGKTVSTASTVTIGSDTLMINVDKASVVRGKPFSVTLTGQASTKYNIWLKGITSDTAPRFVGYQEDVDPSLTNNTFATIKTDSSGKRTVAFTTSVNTKEQKYTIRAESMDKKKNDEVTINVVKGGLTLVASGDQNYFLGEEIDLSGTNSETDYVYFFIVGPNLNSNGAGLNEPGEPVDHGFFVEEDVLSEDTFTYEWSTAQIDLDAGTYTIYAVSQPVDKSELQNVSYATVSVVIKKPYVSARASQSTIAKGDKLFIEGDAQGNPSSGVAVWILGKNYAKRYTQSVESDSTYKYEIPGAETSSMASGQYFIVVQHPMQNDRFDININGEYVENVELGSSGTTIFKLYGSGSLQGSDAAEALIQAISDPNVDDTYTKLTIIVSEPLITISSIGDRHVGDKFNITGKTNLAVDDEILMEVYSSSFKPTQKVQSGEFSGATGNIKVKKGEDGMNTFSFDVDASTFKVDEYIVVAQSIVQDATGTALFNIVEGASTNPVVTPVAPVVTAPPVIVTAPPTVPPTAPPTPIPTTIVPTTTKSPGFGAVFALIGLGAVAFIVVRRE